MRGSPPCPQQASQHAPVETQGSSRMDQAGHVTLCGGQGLADLWERTPHVTEWPRTDSRAPSLCFKCSQLGSSWKMNSVLSRSTMRGTVSESRMERHFLASCTPLRWMPSWDRSPQCPCKWHQCDHWWRQAEVTRGGHTQRRTV